MSEVVMIANFAGCMCRECGALCAVEAWEDRDGLCGRCAHRPRNPRNKPAVRPLELVQFTPSPEVADVQRVAYVNGREIVTTGDDPIRKAIDRAFDSYLQDAGL